MGELLPPWGKKKSNKARTTAWNPRMDMKVAHGRMYMPGVKREPECGPAEGEGVQPTMAESEKALSWVKGWRERLLRQEWTPKG